MVKLFFQGTILSIQPRIRLNRSFDESSHSYLGYALKMTGSIAGEDRDFSLGIGKAAQKKHRFQAGDQISGTCVPVADERLEPVAFYKVSQLKKISSMSSGINPPPWEDVPPDLDTYRWRGHRRLATRTYDSKCSTCIWGCRMPVEMIIDQWNPSKKKYRRETFCYGPLSCTLYKAGPNRKVEGRNGMVYVEEDWVDEERTSHRERDV